MVGIASGAWNLALPLAAVGHPAAAPPATAMAIVAPAVAAAPVVSAIPAVSGPGSLEEIVVREVRRVVRERPDPASDTALRGFGDGAERVDAGLADDDGDDATPPDLGDAVIAAHAARIADLKRRMDALRSDRAPPDRLDDLRVRLRKAEAARQLAVERVAVERAPFESPAVERVAFERPHPIGCAVRGDPAVCRANRMASGVIADRSVAHRLAHARQALATARGLLEDGVKSPSEPAIVIAGLWRWSGSDTWSLADCGAKTA